MAHTECLEFVVLAEAEEEGVFGRVVTGTASGPVIWSPFLVPVRQQVATSSAVRGSSSDIFRYNSDGIVQPVGDPGGLFYGECRIIDLSSPPFSLISFHRTE